MHFLRASRYLVLALVLVAACKKDGHDNTCTFGDDATCNGAQVCEQVVGQDPQCFDPVVVRGRVFDASDDSAIADATVVGIDVSGALVASSVTTDATGVYELSVPATRHPDGTLVSGSITLRVDASGYLAFPKAPRIALPIDLTTGVVEDGRILVSSVATDVSLFALPAGTYGSIVGAISGVDARGALVVADQGVPASAVSTAIVDADGTYELWNVPVGVATTVSVYAAGVHVTPATTTVPGASPAVVVDFVSDAVGLATVSGGLNIVAGASFTSTSVILVAESTYSALLKAGYMPLGLRDGTVTSADTSFSIANVPPGRYVLLASFENDGLVRDPDTSIAGTDVRFVQVSDAGAVTVTSARSEDLVSIKVTDPIGVVGPGATGLEVVTAVPTFRWSKYPGVDHYEIRLFDAFGTLVYQDTAIAPQGGADPVVYDLVAGSFVPAAASVSLASGMVYQFRVVAIKTSGAPISSTEDLLGVFQFQP